jgi:hypothetical protein
LKIEIPEIRAFEDGKVITPRIITPDTRTYVVPRVRNTEDRELRDEIRSLRDEVQKLRDEVKRGRPGRSNPNDTFGPAV